MNKDYKVTVLTLTQRLSQAKVWPYTTKQLRDLIYCWVKHPRYKSPGRSTLVARIKNDGYLWLKDTELNSFSRYCGCDLT